MCLPWKVALIALLVLVESVDEVVGEEAAGGSEGVWIKQRKMQRMVNGCDATAV